MSGIAPWWRIEVDGEDISDAIGSRLLSIRVTDAAGGETSDGVSIEIEDTDGAIELPATGVQLSIWIGYDGSGQLLGRFQVDAVACSGPPDRITIDASGMRWGRTAGGATKKTRSWDGKTLAQIVERIAADHDMTAVVDDQLGAIKVAHIDQTDESDAAFLSRLVDERGGVVKVNASTIMVIDPGQSRASAGDPVAITREEITSYDFRAGDRSRYQSVAATWIDHDTAAEREEVVGDGEPVARLRDVYESQQVALQAAQAALDRSQRRGSELGLTLPGDPSWQADGRLIVRGIREGVDGEWLVEKLEHDLSRTGYTMTASCVVPRS